MQAKVITKSINIGIDFGTSYSKVCFEDETKEKRYVVFCTKKPEYKHSKVYFDYVNKIFHYQKPENKNSLETIKYFKYSMIDKSLPHSKYIPDSNPKTTPEKLCCIFFIACLINQTKKYIKKHYIKNGVLQFDWNITMGVPIDNYSNEFRSLYDIILQIAIKLSENLEKLNKYSISLNDLDNFWQENQNIKPPCFKESPNNTLSELYAESLAFLEDRNVPEGLYAIIDIGGATVDMAVISKTQDESNKQKFKYGVIAECIEPLGIEILIHKIAQSSDMHSSIKKFLENDKLQFSDIEYNKVKERELSQKMQESFARLAIDAKEKFRETLIKQKGKLPIILCGGGAHYKWYKSCISATWDRILNTLDNVGFRLKFMSVEDLKRYYKLIDHRLIISSGLAQDIQRIPDLDGFPWDYDKVHYGTKNYPFDDIMKEKHGKIY